MSNKVKANERTRRRKRSPGSTNFLVTLMTMIDENHASKVVRWSETSDSFIIGDNEKFFKLLPKYFKTKNYSSFVRQLNMYDFHKVKNDNGAHEFRHPKFRRRQPELLKGITRKMNEPSRSRTEILTDRLEGDASPDSMTKSSLHQSSLIQSLMKEQEERKQEYEKKILKLLFLLFTVCCDDSKLSDLKVLFEDISSEAAGDGGDQQLREFLFQASKLFFDKHKKTNIDTILKSISPDGFRVLFHSPSAMPAISSNLIMPQIKSNEASVRSREDSVSYQFRFGEMSNQISPLRHQFNYILPSVEFSENGSVSDRGYFKRLGSVLSTPKNEGNLF